MLIRCRIIPIKAKIVTNDFGFIISDNMTLTITIQILKIFPIFSYNDDDEWMNEWNNEIMIIQLNDNYSNEINDNL